MENYYKRNYDIEILIKLFCFQEEIYKKCELLNDSCSEPKKVIFIKRNVMKKYKDYFDYEYLSHFLGNSEILNCIKENDIINYDKINISFLSKITEQLPRFYIRNIENIDKEELKDAIKKEDKKEWNYKYFKTPEKYNKSHLDILDEFEIINEEILLLLFIYQIEINNFFIGEFFIGYKKTFFGINDFIYEIGHFNLNKNFIVEYLFQSDNIRKSKILIDELTRNNFLKKIDNNDNSLIKKYKYYKVKEDQIVLNNQSIKIKTKSLKNFKNKDFLNISSELNNKLILSILLLSQKGKKEKYHEKIYLLNKNILNNQNIEFLLNKNERFQRYNDNNNYYFPSKYLIDKIISFLDSEELKEIYKSIYESNISYKPEYKEILFDSKKIKIYNKFIFVYINDDYEEKFSSDKDLFMEFICLDKADLLINRKNNNIFIGNYDEKNYYFNINLILIFNDSKYLDSELKKLKYKYNKYNKYIEDKLLFLDDNNKDSPIFSDKEIIGYGFKYDSSINNVSNFINYPKYLNNKVLISNILFFFNSNKIEYYLNSDKVTTKKFYLINHNLLNKFQIENKYNQVLYYLKNTIKDISFFENVNMKNIYYCLKKIPNEILQLYDIKTYDHSFFELNFEPNLNLINYVSNNKNTNLIFYNEFQMIEESIFELINEGYKYKDILSDCWFYKGNIIIDMTNSLNQDNNNICLVGKLEQYIFKVEYIFIYELKYSKDKHIESIIQNLDNYLNNLTFNNITSLNVKNKEEPIGLIIKCNNDNNIDNSKFIYNKLFEEMNQKISDYENELVKRENNNEILKKKNIELNKKNIELEEKVNQLKINNEVSNDEIVKLNKKINELKNKLDNEKNNNKELKKEVVQKVKEKYEIYINEKDINIKTLNNTINDLNNLIEKNNNIINEQQIKIEELENILKSDNIMNKIIEYMEKLEAKKDELKIYKYNIPFKLLKDEKLMAVIFISDDQKIHYPMICKNTDQFDRLESELYKIEEYKHLKKNENYFLFNGNKINRFDTLEENGIKNGSVITLHQVEI